VRKLILHMMTTMDGFIADSSGRLTGSWTNWDEEMKAFYHDLFAATDTIMYGRIIYEEMVPAWEAIADGNAPPGVSDTEADRAFGRRLRELRKIVISTTLDQAEERATVIGDNLAGQIAAIKNQPGSDILLYCGPRLMATLTHLGLIDEYMLYVNPTALGKGVHLFGQLTSALQLKLLQVKAFSSGTILTTYQPARTA
jgi:dihydrofolate reductase